MRGSMTWDQANGDDGVADSVEDSVPITPALENMTISRGSTPAFVALAVENGANGATTSPLAQRNTNSAARRAETTPSPPAAMEVDEAF